MVIGLDRVTVQAFSQDTSQLSLCFLFCCCKIQQQLTCRYCMQWKETLLHWKDMCLTWLGLWHHNNYRLESQGPWALTMCRPRHRQSRVGRNTKGPMCLHWPAEWACYIRELCHSRARGGLAGLCRLQLPVGRVVWIVNSANCKAPKRGDLCQFARLFIKSWIGSICRINNKWHQHCSGNLYL